MSTLEGIVIEEIDHELAQKSPREHFYRESPGLFSRRVAHFKSPEPA